MTTPTNPGNHPQKSLVECDDKSPLQENISIDQPTQECADGPTQKDSQETVARRDEFYGWLEDASNKKVGIGQQGLCDPMQTGSIVNDLRNPDRNTIYRHAKGIRGADEAMHDLFRNVIVIDDDGKGHPVPIIWASQERAVAFILQDNMRKDNSLVVDRIRLPMMAISSSDIQQDNDRYIYHQAIDYIRDAGGKPTFTQKERYERDTVFGVARGIPVNITYTLYIWTMYIEDMNQIVEQILTKFSPVAYIRVRGVSWEIIVTNDSVTNNLDLEPGDQKKRVIKYQFTMTAKTFIPQPLKRHKAVLKTKVNIFNSTEPKEINDLLGRLEKAVEEFE